MRMIHVNTRTNVQKNKGLLLLATRRLLHSADRPRRIARLAPLSKLPNVAAHDAEFAAVAGAPNHLQIVIGEDAARVGIRKLKAHGVLPHRHHLGDGEAALSINEVVGANNVGAGALRPQELR